jgi:hypothetical protein
MTKSSDVCVISHGGETVDAKVVSSHSDTKETLTSLSFSKPQPLKRAVLSHKQVRPKTITIPCSQLDDSGLSVDDEALSDAGKMLKIGLNPRITQADFDDHEMKVRKIKSPGTSYLVMP